MITGYKQLNENINQTIGLISNIKEASNEQLKGIEQINHAINELEHQTQQNAVVASQTQNVAIITDEIAKLVVSNANEKEFKGKNIVQSKNIEDLRKAV
jgi:methyl-accepting chemotaxis protein